MNIKTVSLKTQFDIYIYIYSVFKSNTYIYISILQNTFHSHLSETRGSQI